MRQIILLFLLAVSPCLAAPQLQPASVIPGEAFRVAFDQARIALVRFENRPVVASPRTGGSEVLLAVGLETKPGRYPVETVWTDRAGKTFHQRLWLEVGADTRPAERLTLPKSMVSPQKKSVLARIKKERKTLQTLYARRSWPIAATRFHRPVADEISSVFGLKRILNDQPRSPHSGTDFRSPKGTPVKAPAAGQVILTDSLYYTGRTVMVDHGDGLISLYAHLSEILCQQGQKIQRGEVLGRVGSTGRSTGPHLHWGVRLRGKRIDPLSPALSAKHEE